VSLLKHTGQWRNGGQLLLDVEGEETEERAEECNEEARSADEEGEDHILAVMHACILTKHKKEVKVGGPSGSFRFLVRSIMSQSRTRRRESRYTAGCHVTRRENNKDLRIPSRRM
jgi:hypothetical protein